MTRGERSRLVATCAIVVAVMTGGLAGADDAKAGPGLGPPVFGAVTIDGGSLGTPPVVTWTSELSCAWMWNGWDETQAVCHAASPPPISILSSTCGVPTIMVVANGLQGWVEGDTVCDHAGAGCMDETWTSGGCHAENWPGFGEPMPLVCSAKAAGLLSTWSVTCGSVVPLFGEGS